MMSPEKKDHLATSFPPFQTFLSPAMAVGLVSAVLIALILTMGIRDLRSSERTLVGFMEDQGMRIIGSSSG